MDCVGSFLSAIHVKMDCVVGSMSSLRFPFSSTRSPPDMISPSFHMNFASSVSCVSSSTICCISGKSFAMRMMLSAQMKWLHSLPSMWYPVPSSLHLVMVLLYMLCRIALNSSWVRVPPYQRPCVNGISSVWMVSVMCSLAVLSV